MDFIPHQRHIVKFSNPSCKDSIKALTLEGLQKDVQISHLLHGKQ